MIKSMTGYAREQAIINSYDITIELRSVNHRYCEISVKTPRFLSFMEEKINNIIKSKISRGKVEAYITVNSAALSNEQITPNLSVIKDYIAALDTVKSELGLSGEITLRDILRIPDAFTVIKTDPSGNEILENGVMELTDKAVDALVNMRLAEGDHMYSDIVTRLELIEKNADIIQKRSPEINAAYRERLYNRMSEILDGKNIDESRILIEAGIFAEKTAVDEETVRLKSHVIQFRKIMESDPPAGRKLDFLIQEMNREVNTIGSKVQDVYVTNLVVDLKSEIEKIREQIQNVE